MSPSHREDATRCPCLTPAVERSGGEFRAPVYCRPGPRRVRVPSRDQLTWLCTGPRYQECPGYRRWTASRGWDEV
jgi:hypothetical protein